MDATQNPWCDTDLVPWRCSCRGSGLIGPTRPDPVASSVVPSCQLSVVSQRVKAHAAQETDALRAGRDHWGPAASLVFAGAGVRGGKRIGATDKNGAYVTTRPYSPADVYWTIYDAIGVDPRKNLTTPDGRPMEILDEGEPMHELYS